MAAGKATRARSPKPRTKPVAKKAAPAKKAGSKKPLGTLGKKAVAKKAVAKKPLAKKPLAKTQVAKKPLAKKPLAKKPLAKKPLAKKPLAKTQVAKKPLAAAPALPRSTAARDALTTLAQKRAINATLSPVDGTALVDAYMRDVDHPFKAEMQAVRQIILGASSKISERIKWNAPSFYYKEDLGAFHTQATEFAHLILLFPGGSGMQDDSGLLEGKHKDRREAKFRSMDEVAAKKPALEKLIKRWITLRDS